jgi:hypothetical protein
MGCLPSSIFFGFKWTILIGPSQKRKSPHTLKAPQYKNVYFSVKWKWKQTKDFESKSFHSPKIKENKEVLFNLKRQAMNTQFMN